MKAELGADVQFDQVNGGILDLASRYCNIYFFQPPITNLVRKFVIFNKVRVKRAKSCIPHDNQYELSIYFNHPVFNFFVFFNFLRFGKLNILMCVIKIAVNKSIFKVFHLF